MTKDDWELLAKKLEREILTNNHTEQTNDLLGALKSIAWGMWSDANTKKPD